jgi:bacterioferritin-associated ferredoxin
MYLCNCNGLTEREVHEALATGCRSAGQVYRCLGVKPQCGRCVPDVRGLVRGHGASAACAGKLGGDD